MIMRMISIDIYFLIILCGGFENGFGKGGGGIYIRVGLKLPLNPTKSHQSIIINLKHNNNII
jgi:hypothetical protein